MSGPTDAYQATAQGIVALLFLILAAAEGSPRILRVLDSRRTVVIRRSAHYFATTAYTAAPSFIGGSANRRYMQPQQRPSSMGSQTVRQGGPQQNDLPPLLSDNRFLLGCVALLAGVLRAAFSLTILIFTNSRNSSEITSSGFLSDSLTLPLAWLTDCLVVAVLFAHRDLMQRLKTAYAIAEANTQRNQQQQQAASQQDSDSGLKATPRGGGGVEVNGSGNTNNPGSDNNLLALDQQSATAVATGESSASECCSEINAFVVRYRAFIVMIIVALILIAGEVVESQMHNSAGETVSTIVSFVLGTWAAVAAVESVSTLRQHGRLARRVIAAIFILSVYLIGRGCIVLQPIQARLCESKNFWHCAFLFTSVDAVGTLLSIAVLP